MGSSTRFTKSCPTCSRKLDISVELIGRNIACPHCRSEFKANLNHENDLYEDDQLLDERIDRLLAIGSQSNARFQYDHHASDSSTTYEV